MPNLRDTAQNCLGINGGFSVLADFYGYPFGHPGRTLSLRQQLDLVRGETVDFNLIRVGIENFNLADNQEIQTAVQITREIYAQAGLGVRRLVWAFITVAQAGGFVSLESTGEASDLTDAWNGPDPDALDVFIVENFLANCTPTGCTIGLSAVEGPCDKDDKDEMTGAVTSIGNTGVVNSGVLLAHEVGHYLGLDHTNAASNLMRPNIAAANTNLTDGQESDLRNHCFVEDVC